MYSIRQFLDLSSRDLQLRTIENLQKRSAVEMGENDGDDYVFHVYNRESDHKQPTYLGGGSAAGLNAVIIDALRILETRGRNIKNFIGDEEDWKEFLYDCVIKESRKKYAWDEYWVDNVPDITIELNTVIDALVELMFDEEESFFVELDASDDEESEWSGSDWTDSDYADDADDDETRTDVKNETGDDS